MKKLAYVDALRGLGITGVVVLHVAQYGSAAKNISTVLNQVIQFGAVGVQLFYMMSALTLFLSLNHREKKDGKINTKQFFARRFLRIAPLYYLAVGYYWWESSLGPIYWIASAQPVSLANIISHILFLHGLNPYWINTLVPGGWSIAVEMGFYCLVPLLFTRIRTLKNAFIFLGISLIFRFMLIEVLNFLHLAVDHNIWVSFLGYILANQLPVFGFGILMYFLIKNPPTFSNLKRFSPVLLLLIPSYILALKFDLISLNILTATAFLGLGLLLHKFHIPLLNNPLTRYFGRLSYGIYLVQFAVLFWMRRIGMIDFMSINTQLSAVLNYGIRLVLVLTFSVIISETLVQLVEKPIERSTMKWIKSL